MDFKLQDIEAITNNFAEEQKVGSGAYGDVYRAMHQGEVIAVKKFHQMLGLDNKHFDREFRNLCEVRHQNVVRLIGYCYEYRHKYMEHNGELVFASMIERVLCFEYMHGGSLDKYIQDEACGLEWPTCYKIIKGTCEGINYLHSSQGKPIFHLKLKPSNILLDESMTPKIGGLGLSRLVASLETDEIDETEMYRPGVPGFMPPEYIEYGIISKKFDVFCLGVIIIKMLAGDKSYFRCSEMPPEQFIELVSEIWRKKLQAKPGYSSHEIDILGVTSCVEIAISCVDKDRNKRPCINDIVHELDQLEAKLKAMSLASDVSNLTVQNKLGDSRSMDFKLQDIEAITNNFAEERKVGSGTYGDVYRAMHQGEVIAMKKLHQVQGLDNKDFDSEFRSLREVRHQNVVRLIGYCCESRHKYMEHNGELVFASMTERVLCFEYMHGGSLDKYIQDEACGLEWPTCYKIIKGTCEGINYLHSSQGKPIFHLKLKPSKILLDESMTPKIGGIGLSRLVASLEADEIDETEMYRPGAPGFMPPEYIHYGFISKKVDVFSLGVIIIKMLAGDKNYPRCYELSPEQFIELVTENWTKRLQVLMRYSFQEDILRVRTCVEIALRCVASDRNKRPTVTDIVHELEELEANITIMSYLIVQTASRPHQVSLQHLKDITDNFSEDRILGSGGFGVVYKGLLQNGEVVAVKKLVQSTPKSQKQFENEVDLLMTLKHPNVVRLLDYCYETQPLLMPYKGKFVPALNIERLLCLEYMPNGSLDKYITDVSSGHDWHTRCKIIEGISFGLQYLHEESNGPIIHLDLKPANILLDENLVPKTTDFGLSRLFDNNQTTRTANSCGTLGYMALEYQLRGIITPMADIFSLGVIIMEVITGHREYPYDIRSSDDFIKDELQLWRNKLQREPGYTSLETDCQQIKRCIQIGLLCVNPERTKRPTMKKIIDMLQGFESMDSYIRNELSS